MKQEFQISYRYSDDNLHIRLRGNFNGICAQELFKLLRKNDSSRKVFVNTHDLIQVTDEGASLFKRNMKRELLPREGLYFKGRKGFKIGPDGTRVLIYKERSQGKCSQGRSKCCGKCKHKHGGKVQNAERTISLVKNEHRVFKPINYERTA